MEVEMKVNLILLVLFDLTSFIYCNQDCQSVSEYKGDCEDGLFHGLGTFIHPDNGRYDGNWKRGVKHGHGTFIFSDGRTYVGQFVNGMRAGKGTFTWPHGDIYEGGFKDGFRDGFGRYNFSNGNTYFGQWSEGYQQGIGIFTWANGRRYVGEYAKDEREGRGKFTWPDGDIYLGGFKGGFRRGFGIYNYSNGNIYIGQWTNGDRHGNGTLIWADGSLLYYEGINYSANNYTGEWIKDSRSGYGTLTFSNGNRYEGEFNNNYFHGFGKFNYSNGNAYIGEFVDGFRAGNGTFFWIDGRTYTGVAAIAIESNTLCANNPTNYVTFDGRCVDRENLWDCNGNIQSLEVPCDKKCYNNYILVNKTCLKSRDAWICNGTGQLLTEPCHGKCPEGDVLDEKKCIDKQRVWLCNGKHQLLKKPCNGTCSGSDILVDGTCLEHSTSFFGGKALTCEGSGQLKEKPCKGECLTDYFLVDGICHHYTDVWICSGMKQSQRTPCKGKCYPQFAKLFNGTCERARKTWICDGKRQLKEDPCRNECPDGYCIENGICIRKHNFWNCNGRCQGIGFPCNNTCVETHCFFEGKCTYVKNEFWSCGSQCQSIKKLCSGECAKTYNHNSPGLSSEYVNYNNTCINEALSWECNGLPKLLNESCNRGCPKNRCFNEEQMNCEKAPHEHYSCREKCQSWRIPCNQECLKMSKPLELVEGSCYYNLHQSEIWQCDGKQQFLSTSCKGLCSKNMVLIDKVCEDFKKAWSCKGSSILLKTPCNGQCPINLTLVKDSCLIESEFWICDNVKQAISTPCYGLCSHVTKKKYFDQVKDAKYLYENLYGILDKFNFTKFEEEGGIYLTDYVNCDNQCLLREDAWKVNDQCISKKKSYNGKCFKNFILHTKFDGKKLKDGVECFPREFTTRNSISKDGLLSIVVALAGAKYTWLVSAVTSQSLVSAAPRTDLGPGDYLYLTSSGSAAQVHPTSMGVYQKLKENYHNKFPVYQHTEKVYFIFVDKRGHWAASENTGSESFTFYHPGTTTTPEQPPTSGWRYRDSRGNWHQDQGIQLLDHIVTEGSRGGTCPFGYCWRGEKCCSLVWAGYNRGHICPPKCD